VQRRLAVARHELQQSDHYEHQVMNVTVDDAVEEISDILSGHGFEPEST
jgi:guanylate kinase